MQNIISGNTHLQPINILRKINHKTVVWAFLNLGTLKRFIFYKEKLGSSL